MLYRIIKHNLLSGCYRKPHLIWFSSHEEMRIFVRYVNSLPSKFWQKGDTHYAMDNEFRNLFWMIYVNVSTKFAWERQMAYLTKHLNFVRDYWTKSYGVFSDIQIIIDSFIILNYIQINWQFWKLLVLKVRLHFFFLGGGGDKQKTDW